jgi:hypothetical protein
MTLPLCRAGFIVRWQPRGCNWHALARLLPRHILARGRGRPIGMSPGVALYHNGPGSSVVGQFGYLQWVENVPATRRHKSTVTPTRPKSTERDIVRTHALKVSGILAGSGSAGSTDPTTGSNRPASRRIGTSVPIGMSGTGPSSDVKRQCVGKPRFAVRRLAITVLTLRAAAAPWSSLLSPFYRRAGHGCGGPADIRNGRIARRHGPSHTAPYPGSPTSSLVGICSSQTFVVRPGFFNFPQPPLQIAESFGHYQRNETHQQNSNITL